MHNDTFKTPKLALKRQYKHIIFVKRIQLTTFINFLKLLVLLKSNLKQQN